MRMGPESVNMVSAPVFARERNMKVSEVTGTRTPDYQTLLRVSVTCGERVRTVAGSLFGGTRPRVVEVQDMAFEAELDGPMLFVRNRDKPGFIGTLGRTLGDAGVNIASFHLGRTAPGEDAICLVQVDQPVDEALLAAVRALPHVVQAKTIHF